MKSLRFALCGAASALLAAATPAAATTTVASGNYTGNGFQSAGGEFSLGPGNYLISLTFTQPVSDLDGLVEKTFGYDDYCNFGSGVVYCGGDDVPIDLAFQMVTPELYQLLLTVNGPSSVPGSGGSAVREDTYESCCGFGFDFTSATGGHFTLSYASVPEPATWAMMLSGFGAIGFSMRRRAAKVRLATS